MFSKLPLRTRLIGAFVSVAIAGVVTGLGAFLALQQVNQDARSLYEEHLLGLSAVKEAEIHLIQVARYRAQFARAGDQASRDKYRALFDSHLAETRQWLEKAKPTFTTEADRQALAQTEAVLDAYIPHGQAFLEVMGKTEPVGIPASVEQANQEAISTFKVVTDSMESLASLREKVGAEAAANAQNTFHHVTNAVVAWSLLAMASAIALGLWIARVVLGQVGGEPAAAVSVARTVAAGQLDAPIHLAHHDQSSILAAMRDMRDHLISLVSGIRTSSDNVAVASKQIAAGNVDLSQRTETQASHLQRTAATMLQLREAVELNARNADEAASMAANVTTAVETGGEAVARVVTTMTDISQASRQISDIIGVIDGIAFQTNILALNAAVEAARAGEQGRGFAVVASEVRSLAHRSSEAAREIKQLITTSAERVEAGSAQVQEAGDAIVSMVNRVRNMAHLIDDISRATREQTQGIGQVGEAIAELDRATQQNAALVEESAAATASLSHQAEQLLHHVSRFKMAA